jgi:hypothetical protein
MQASRVEAKVEKFGWPTVTLYLKCGGRGGPGSVVIGRSVDKTEMRNVVSALPPNGEALQFRLTPNPCHVSATQQSICFLRQKAKAKSKLELKVPTIRSANTTTSIKSKYDSNF